MNTSTITADITTTEKAKQYALLWSLYTDCKPSNKIILERAMDKVQDSFTYEEFQIFKKTLQGYEKHWKNLAEKHKQALEHKNRLNWNR